jgi:carbon-monoxide dehydrogenase medium subunit
MYENAEISAAYPGLMDSARLIGGVQIQGRASMGGNLCNASPAADSIPSLIAHRAICHIAGPNGRSQVAVEDFCVAPGRNILRSGEFLVYIEVPAPKAGFGAAYLRFIPRNEMDIAVVGAGASVVLDESRTRIVEARVSLGAVGPTPLLARQASEMLTGKSIGAEAIDAAAHTARAETSCISDMRGTADFRRHLSEVLTRRALNIAIDRAKAA